VRVIPEAIGLETLRCRGAYIVRHASASQRPGSVGLSRGAHIHVWRSLCDEGEPGIILRARSAATKAAGGAVSGRLELAPPAPFRFRSRVAAGNGNVAGSGSRSSSSRMMWRQGLPGSPTSVHRPSVLAHLTVLLELG